MLDMTLVNISDDIIVTERVQEKLKKSAKQLTPLTTFDLYVPIGAVAVYFGALLVWGLNGFIFGWIPALIFYMVLSIPRNNSIKSKVLELAKHRKVLHDEYRRFYSSGEWKSLRIKFLKANTNICRICGIQIEKSIDLTVDHIKPRSKYPELALSYDNLMVLCRRCNSSKGDKKIEI